MIRGKFIPLVFRQVFRRRVPAAMTVAGIAAAMFLFTAVLAMQAAVREATSATAKETNLIVYRKDRFCPATSQLPQDYVARIERIEGVRAAIPVKVVVSNCRTSLDVVTFRGVPKDKFLADRGKGLELISGSIEEWQSRTDAALVGELLARRRGLKPGQMFDAAGITAYVAGVIRSDEAQDQNTAFTALEFIQLAGRSGLGVVTQFNVKVDDPAQLGPVADRIDEMFATAQEPTATFSEQAFIGRVAEDVVELVRFAGWLGIGCLVAVGALIANAVILSLQHRIAEHAVLQALGYTQGLLVRLVVAEGLLIAMTGGIIGGLGAVALAHYGGFALSVEGTSIPIEARPIVLVMGVGVCAVLGVGAALFPAWRATRRSIAQTFRAV